MAKDLRKEQLALLKFEKKLAGLAAFVAASSATAASAGEKLNGEATLTAYNHIKDALVNLADVTAEAHRTLQQSVVEIGARALEVGGGMPKPPPSEVVRSLLGL